MKFATVAFGEKLSSGRALPPKARMEDNARSHAAVKPPTANPHSQTYLNAQRMKAESDEWYTNVHTTNTADGSDNYRNVDGVPGRIGIAGGAGLGGASGNTPRLVRTNSNMATYVRSSSAYGGGGGGGGGGVSAASLKGGASDANPFAWSGRTQRTPPPQQQQLQQAAPTIPAAANDEDTASVGDISVIGTNDGVPTRIPVLNPLALGQMGTPSSTRPVTAAAAAVGGNQQQHQQVIQNIIQQQQNNQTSASRPVVASMQRLGMHGSGGGGLAADGRTYNVRGRSGAVALGAPTALYRYPAPDQMRQPTNNIFPTGTTTSATYTDPTLGTSVPRIRQQGLMNRGDNPMYRTINSQAYGSGVVGGNNYAGMGGGGVGSAGGDTAKVTAAANRDAMVGGQGGKELLAYNEDWVPRTEGDGNARITTATATTTQGGVPLAISHPSDERRGGHKDLDTVVRSVGGPKPTSIGAKALEAIRQEKHYRARITAMVKAIDDERQSLMTPQLTAQQQMAQRMGYGNGGQQQLPSPAIPLMNAGGPIYRQAAILDRMDAIQQQIRKKVDSRAGYSATYEQKARMLQSMLEQFGGITPSEATMAKSNTLLTPQQQQQRAIAAQPLGLNGRALGVVPGQPTPLRGAVVANSATAASGTDNQQQLPPPPPSEINADQLVRALRQGFAIPITVDEADAFIDHCDIDEKGSVSVREMADGIMAGVSPGDGGNTATPLTGGVGGMAANTITGRRMGQQQHLQLSPQQQQGSTQLGEGPDGINPQMESIIAEGARSPHAPYHKASDVFAYLRRKRLGALANPTIRRIILSIKARLLERSIANNKHLGPDNLAAVGSMRSYLVMILTRFPTTRAVTSPEAYYSMLRAYELQQLRAAQQQADYEAARQRYLKGHPLVYGAPEPAPFDPTNPSHITTTVKSVQQQQQPNATTAAQQQELQRAQKFLYGNAAPTNPITGAGGGAGGFYGNNANSALRCGRATTAYNRNASSALPSYATTNGYGTIPAPPPQQPMMANAPIQLPADYLHQQVITPIDLLNGLQGIGVRGVTMAEVKALLAAANAPDGITPKAFVALMRGTLSRRRRRIIREVFDSLDANKDGQLSYDEVMGSYDASLHPAVLVGDTTAEEVKRQFLTYWLRDTNNDGVISWEEFLNTYKDIADEVEHDDYFELLMRNCWHLSGGTTAAATNTTCRRVLVTFYDGSQRVEEIRNDIGIKASDKATMIRRLEQQGVKGIKAIELYG